jgi:hypothetical protein
MGVTSVLATHVAKEYPKQLAELSKLLRPYKSFIDMTCCIVVGCENVADELRGIFSCSTLLEFLPHDGSKELSACK